MIIFSFVFGSICLRYEEEEIALEKEVFTDHSWDQCFECKIFFNFNLNSIPNYSYSVARQGQYIFYEKMHSKYVTGQEFIYLMAFFKLVFARYKGIEKWIKFWYTIISGRGNQFFRFFYRCYSVTYKLCVQASVPSKKSIFYSFWKIDLLSAYLIR